MASVKLGTLVIRTVAKPISNSLKNYAESSPRFRTFCINLAQFLWRQEIRLRERLLGEKRDSVIHPLNDRKAIQNGANFIAEGFLFSVAASLILLETWRTSHQRNQNSSRTTHLETDVKELEESLTDMKSKLEHIERHLEDLALRSEDVQRIMMRVVEIGMRGGFISLADDGEKEGRSKEEQEAIDLSKERMKRAALGTLLERRGDSSATEPHSRTT